MTDSKTIKTHLTIYKTIKTHLTNCKTIKKHLTDRETIKTHLTNSKIIRTHWTDRETIKTHLTTRQLGHIWPIVRQLNHIWLSIRQLKHTWLKTIMTQLTNRKTIKRDLTNRKTRVLSKRLSAYTAREFGFWSVKSPMKATLIEEPPAFWVPLYESAVSRPHPSYSWPSSPINKLYMQHGTLESEIWHRKYKNAIIKRKGECALITG